jgi:hypothetical protein
MTIRFFCRKATHAARRNAALSTISTLAWTGLALLLMVGAPSKSWAQSNPLKLGQVTTFSVEQPCPAGEHGSTPLKYATCYSATVDDCSSHQSGVTIPPINANVAVSTPPNWNNSTIFLHGGGNGKDYFDAKPDSGTYVSYANQYYNAGFQVVQIAWLDNWADNTNEPPTKVVKYEACRTATILNYAYTSPLIHNSGGNSTGAMCAQGHSAGSAAMTYPLAWYAASSYLNNVVLTSGPVYANIQAGCQYPPATQFKNPITVCPSGQFGCIGSNWTDAVQYLNDGTSSFVAGETNHPAGNCNNYTGSGTPTTSDNQNWGGMSIVSTGASYSYPKVSMYAFLCSSGQSTNNSAAQGQLFYKNITSNSGLSNFAVYNVANCGGDEEIWDGTISNGSSAFTTSAQDMLNSCK